jgi:3',5'-cyclic AMP phosphodiesterase CpdA
MRTVAHLSDLHFGRLDTSALDSLLRAVSAAKPNVVVISGDLTQRARLREFRAARHFLNKLPGPQVIVPGNHDVPLYNLLRRWIRPFDRYREYIADDLEPFFWDQEIAIAGVNTARGLAFKGGRINRDQVARLREKFHRAGDSAIKIVVSHHPFDVPGGRHERLVVGRADMAMRTLLGIRVDMFLTGHLHLSSILQTTTRYKGHNYSALLVEAGTATSNRGRGEPNSFNLIHMDKKQLSIERLSRELPCTSYVVSTVERFRHTEHGWIPG